MTHSSIRVLGPRDPWFHAATKYLNAGWLPFPLPVGKKSPPPEAVTGHANARTPPDGKMITEWLQEHPRDSNIGMRIPRGYIVIDVDAYKNGAEELKTREAVWGKLPPTWRSSARNDGVGGHRWFKLPKEAWGLRWPGKLGKGLDLLTYDYRYAVVWPSVNPDNGEMYRWYEPDQKTAGPGYDGIPVINQMTAELPALWIQGLTNGEVARFLEKKPGVTDKEARLWLKAQREGELCIAMRRAVTRGLEHIGEDGAHDATGSAIYNVVMLAQEGHDGIIEALTEIRDAFYADATDDNRSGDVRTLDEARSEYARLRDGAVRTAMQRAEDNPEMVGRKCSCFIETEMIPQEENQVGYGRELNPPEEYDLNDDGNASMLQDLYPHDMLWVPELGKVGLWKIWDGELWQPDSSGLAWRYAKHVGDRYDDYASQLEASDDAEVKELCGVMRKWSIRCGNNAAVREMLASLQTYEGITVPNTRFDSDPRLLHCVNGVLELNEDGYNFREFRRGDRLSISSDTVFDSDAQDPLWDDYLNKFLPDIELRAYVQQAAGYSLFGGNPDKLIFFLHGPSDTGKTTFVETIGAALGAYAGPFSLSSFRTNADDKPRPDIIKSLSRRFIFASEASSGWNLHADAVKRLVGGDTIDARRMRADHFEERKPAFTPWVATNDVPNITKADAALHNRLRVMPFKSVVRGRAKHAGAAGALTAPNVRTAVLAWLAAGWQAYTVAGELPVLPVVAQKATEDFASGMSDAHTWLKESLRKRHDCMVGGGDVYDSYRVWCDENSIARSDRMTKPALIRWVKNQGIAYSENVRKLRNGSRDRCFVGVKLVTPGGEDEKSVRVKGKHTS